MSKTQTFFRLGLVRRGLALQLVALAAGWAPVRGLAAETSAGGELYVSPTGSDANAGTEASPLGTLEGARDAVRKLKSAGRLPAGGMTVWLRGGDYFLPHPFELTAEDSGTESAPVTYRGVAGEQPRLVNARRVAASDFHPVTDPAALARISEPARGKVVELDLKALGVKHAGPYPDVFTDFGGVLDLFVDDKRMPLSRFPKEGFMTIKRVLDNAGGPKGHAANNAPDWTTVSPAGSGGTFEYREQVAPDFERWRKVLDRGVWLKGYWRVMWQNEAVRVRSIDTGRRTVTLARPVPGGIGNKYHRPEGNGREQYWLLNLLDEVEQPGEWCVDFKDQKLYLYPPASLGRAEILLADDEGPAVHLGGASHVTLADLLVDVGLGDGIRVEGGTADLVAGCTVRNVDKNGVVLDGGTNHAVQSCDLYDLGAGGVWLGGGDEKSSPRVPAGHRAVNNHIHHFAEIQRVYAAGVNCGYTGGGGGGHHPAVGMLVAHNLIHDTPHAGVLFGSWDSVFEYNEVYRYCTVSDDMGAFYCYDSYALDGNQTLRFNLMHDSDDGDGIYFDDDHRDMHVYGNVAWLNSLPNRRGTGFLYKIGTQAKNPQWIECYNNVAVRCNVGYTFVTAQPDRGKIENNLAVGCAKAIQWGLVHGDKAVPAPAGFATGKDAVYDSDPGFVDASRRDVRLKPGSPARADLPGFEQIPFDKIGLYVDEYRRALPDDAGIDRFNVQSPHKAGGYEVEDRK